MFVELLCVRFYINRLPNEVRRGNGSLISNYGQSALALTIAVIRRNYFNKPIFFASSV